MPADSFENMARAFDPVLTQIATKVKALIGKAPGTHLLPDPTMDRLAVWIEPPTASNAGDLDWGSDDVDLILDVCVSVPYESQRASVDRLLAWRVMDVLNTTFTDQMVGIPELRGTRRRSIQPVREQWGDANGPTQLVVRMRLTVPVWTPAHL